MSGSALDAIAHPVTVDYVGAVGKANAAASGIWANRLAQAQQAAGEAQQGAIDPTTGEYSPNQFRQNLLAL